MKIKLSTAAAAVVAGALVFTGCGGGSSNSSSTNVTSASLSSITGSVTASKFENAKVFLDLNLDGEYTTGEPSALTDENGEFTLDYILDGNEYLLIAMGQNGTIKHNDDGTDENATNFVMFTTITEAGDLKINPSTFKTYLSDLNTTFEGLDTNSTSFVNQLIGSDSNASVSTMYNNFIGGKKAVYENTLKEIATYLKSKNSDKKLDSAREDLGLDNTAYLAFDSSDQNSSELAASKAYKTKTIPAKIGSLVVAKPLNKVELEVVDSVDDSNITGVSANSVDENATATNNSIILKKPIFAVVSDNSNKIKVVTGNKSALKDFGDITLSVTAYDDIISIPYYSQLKDNNLTVMLGADITVEDSNGSRIDVADVVSKEISGVILDKHKNDLNASELKYYYLDGAQWKNGGNVTDGGTVDLTDNFKLVPYVLVKENDLQASQTVAVDGLSQIADPVVVAKGKAVSSEASNSKLLAKENEDETIILDAVASFTDSTATFKIPKGYEISEVVVLGETLNKLTEGNNNSIKVDVDNGQASIAEEMNLIVNDSMISELNYNISQRIGMHLDFDNFSLPYYSGWSSETDSNSSDKQKAYWIYDKNVENFLENGSNEFYDGSDIEAGTTLTFTKEDNASDEKKEYTITISAANKTISETKKYYVLSTNTLRKTNNYVYDFSTPNYIKKTRTSTYSSNNIMTQYYDTNISNNYGGTTSTYDFTYNKIDENTTLLTINNLSSVYKYKSTSTAGGTSTASGTHKYTGSVSFTKNKATNEPSAILGGKIYEFYDYSSEYKDSYNTSNYADYFNGISTIYNNGKLDFDGDFKFKTGTYGELSGHALIKNAHVTFSNYKMVPSLSGADTTYSTTQSYLANVTKFSKDWLNGKTLYNLHIDQDTNKFNLVSDTFTDTTISSNGIYGPDKPNNEQNDYNITSSGAIAYFEADENSTEYINIFPSGSNNDYLTICWNGEDNSESCPNLTDQEFYFLDKSKAEDKYYEKIAVNNSWEGTFTVTGGTDCYSGNLNASFTEGYNGSWNAQNSNAESYYGTVEQDGNKFTFKEYSYDTNNYQTVGNGTMDTEGSKISGTWSDSECKGTFELEASSGSYAVQG